MHDSKHWDRVKEIFHRALDLDTEQRNSFIRSECTGDDKLRLEVEALLSASHGPSDFLEPPTPNAAIDLALQSSQLNLVGQRIGPYRIESLIASGGMGTVYRGERDDGQFDQVVAIKIVRMVGHDQEKLVLFRRELQTLARLKHPNIARLIDGGVLTNGTPYLILEYVDGVPINSYSDAHHLDIPSRIDLMLQACKAVQYAHQNLIVHRDLKPNNILVGSKGEVKLLDFGIAKLIPEDPAAPVDQTSTLRLMTPQYASPEQIRGEVPTTASDVYSLGVVSYELLAGHRPYRISKGSEYDSARILAQMEPDTPSNSVYRVEEIDLPDGTTGIVTPESVGQCRGEVPDKLRKRLRGDLDTIVMTALQKERSLRYQSMDRFLEDIELYLQGRPIRARRATYAYRVRKYFHRNPAAATASAIAIFAILAGSLATMLALIRAKESLREANRNAEIAQAEEKKSNQINEFLQTMLASPDPANLGKDVTVLQVLERAGTLLENDQETDVPTKAAMENAIGGAYFELGKLDKAEPHLQKAMELNLAHDGSESLGYAEAVGNWGGLREALGEFGQAEEFQRESLRIRSHFRKENPLSYARGLSNLGSLLERRNKFAEGEPLVREALRIRQENLGEESPDVSKSMQNLAVLLERKGDVSGALPLYERSLAVMRKTRGNHHPETAVVIANLGMLYRDLNQIEKAEPLLQEALELDQRLFGERHPRVANDLDALASLEDTKGDTDKAIELRRHSLDIRIEAFGSNHPDVAAGQNNLATLLVRKGELVEAGKLHEQAYQIRKIVFGENSQQVADSLVNIGAIHDRQHEYEQAKENFRSALEIYRAGLGPSHPRAINVLTNLGVVSFHQGYWDEARSYLETAVTLARSAGRSAENILRASLVYLGRSLLKLRAFEEAAGRLQEAMELCLRTLPKDHWGVFDCRSLLGEAKKGLGNLQEAEGFLLDGYEGLKSAKGVDRETIVEALQRIVSLYELESKPEEAHRFRAVLHEYEGRKEQE